MNEQSKNTDDFDRLLMTVIEDELSDDQRRKLFARLQADPDLRDRYVDLMMLHNEMEWERASVTATDQQQPLQPADEAPGQRRRSLWKPALSLGVAIIAATIIFVVVHHVFLLHPPEPQVVQRPSPQVNRNANAPALRPHIATLSASMDARWGDRGVILDYSELNSGKLLLTEGSAEIMMMSGVRVIIEAPCDLELIDSNSVRLVGGALVARVPDRARGFFVETPTGRITDFGTEFGVNVNGKTDVAVFEGEIELAADGQRLFAGQAVRVDKDKQVSRQSSAELEKKLLRPKGMDKKLAGQNTAAYERWRAYSAELAKDPDLLAYYTFDNSGDENSPLLREARGRTGFDGQVKGPIWTRGRFPGKGALEFGGPKSRNHVELCRAASKEMNFTGSYSIAIWFKVHSFNSLYPTLMYKGDLGWRFVRFREKLVFATNSGFSSPAVPRENALVQTNSSIDKRRWHLLVAVAERNPDDATTTARLYFNGRQQGGVQTWNHLNNTPAPVWIGGNPKHADRDYHGMIDEIAVFTRALDADDVWRMYEAGKSDGAEE
ncbi:MAG: hypothetical protein HN350_21480 [Phycisphaerales bacterium]|jgi:hypothetical protein|nr:hypothetical protein [Phycisphaerales bacterium]